MILCTKIVKREQNLIIYKKLIITLKKTLNKRN